MTAFIVLALVSGAFAAPAVSQEGMAATPHPLATAAALEILEAGGNAVDAAVAATFVVSVTSPFHAGIGGGGFAIVHLEPTASAPGAVEALDFREVAPRAATRDMYREGGKPDTPVVPGASLDGALSVAVPGTVPGLVALHRAHGKLPWRQLLRPAIRVARDGFAVGDDFVWMFAHRREVMTRFASTRAAFMKRDRSGAEVPLIAGDLLKQPDLARTLAEIRDNPRALEEGRAGTALVAALQKHGGIITREDLTAYQPRWRTALCAPWRDLELCTMPPPSSGGVHVLQMLQLLEGTDLAALGWHSPDALHVIIESMRIAFADRATHLGDPAFTAVPVDGLISRAYADERRRGIDPKRAKQSADVKPGTAAQLAQTAAPASPPAPAPRKESADTSHLSVVDKNHNAVSLTFTVNYAFGSGLVADGTGVLLNDEMDDFSAAPGVPNQYGLVGGEANSIAAGKIPLSSMTPLIARKQGRFALSAGAPGGSTIITTVLQTLLHVEVYGMDCAGAVGAPRIHHQWKPDVTRIETWGLDAATERELTARGHVFKKGGTWGNAMCIRALADGRLEGAADPRGEGSAAGP